MNPLQNKWILSFINQSETTDKKYEDCIHNMAEFDTVETFWQVYSHTKLPSKLDDNYDLNLFREGYRPVWEDQKNQNSGKWYICLKHEFADLAWEKSVLACVGNLFPHEVIGITVSKKKPDYPSIILSYWISDIKQSNDEKKIAKKITTVMEFPQNSTLFFKFHGNKPSQKFNVN
ncbi:Eukaryotic initiation factor 4E family protein [Trichomonas vaginalis G3]|uniref:Eukaryotic initiation factor 4E family protein n=1 Tax=Trichomonas vaginalis (strain ATCC PRA-98 / G3) TaxID=412133 RepID=A2G3L7_TRIV3|nr:translation initiation factor protein [Trichomonas vaginalis G3]EAX88253.1 Eukaryotic initiation factor 4E family protein [Trichomonas vaginalis G3]KAI5488050.1 translation initiation factor protein [Trichomonas vaginalis G3]|eukprot:XP_001301183.1 Eukaryotic initiation factor 4E family protein [Trichomonas vaginalis G3]